MISLRRLLLVTLALFLTSCGGGVTSSGSGSGIGGTGITLVSGNVSSVNGELYVQLTDESGTDRLIAISDWIIKAGHAQPSSISSLKVSGGGQSVNVSTSGGFSLPNVAPNENFVLVFIVNGNQSIRMPIGQVKLGAAVTVKNINIDTRSSSARPADIEVVEPEERIERFEQEEEEEEEEEEKKEEKENKETEDSEDSEDAKDSDQGDEVDEVDEVDEIDEEDEYEESR